MDQKTPNIDIEILMKNCSEVSKWQWCQSWMKPWRIFDKKSDLNIKSFQLPKLSKTLKRSATQRTVIEVTTAMKSFVLDAANMWSTAPMKINIFLQKLMYLHKLMLFVNYNCGSFYENSRWVIYFYSKVTFDPLFSVCSNKFEVCVKPFRVV